MVERTQGLTSSSAPVATLPGSYVDWPAIIAGAVVATAIGVIFAGFGAALGLTAISPQEGEGSARWSLIILGIWSLITVIVSYMTGGYIAGRMRRRVDGASADEVSARDGIHGMIVWGLGVLIGAWIAAGAVGDAARAVGSVASGAANAVGAVAQGAGNVVGAAADAATGGEDGTGLDLSGFDPIEAINNRLLLPATGEAIQPDATLSPVARDTLFEVARTGELNEDDRAVLVNEVARVTTLTPQEAEARVDEAVTRITALRDEAAQRLQQAEEAARNAADAARKAAILTGFLVAAGFAVALGAAMWGATTGGRHRDEGRIFSGFRSW